MQLANRRVLVIAGVLIGLALVVLAILTVAKNNSSAPSTPLGTDNQVLDKNSGDTISNPVGKTPDVYGILKDAPLYLGVTNLIDYGLSDVQIQDLKYGFYTYATSVTPKIAQVSITTSSITSVPHDRNDPSPDFALTFNVLFDNKTTLKAKLVYFNTDSIELFLYDSSNQTKFDSGTLTNKTIQTQ